MINTWNNVAGYSALLCALCVTVAFIAAFFQGEPLTPATFVAAAAAPNSASMNNPAFSNLSLSAKAAVVLDFIDGRVLYALNPETQLPLASLTKIPLVLVVSEALTAEAVITIPPISTPQESTERLKPGEHWRVQDIIDLTLVASSNVGAEILAEAANAAIASHYPDAPERDPTLWRMNTLMRDLGFTQTYFLNVSGLDISAALSGAYGSAIDVARLMAYAYQKNQQLFASTARNELLLASASGTKTISVVNTNAIRGAIPGLIMGKTGYTDLAGGNLAIVFDVGLAHPVAAVVLGSTYEGRFADIKKLVIATRAALQGSP